MTKFINLISGPGAGKSTTAAGVFSLLKLHGLSVELVTEYAKDVTYREAFKILKDQLFVLGKQNHRMFNLNGVVDVVITDSPLLLSLIYCDEKDTELKYFVLNRFNKYDNEVYFVKRVKPYRQIGRSQLEEEAKQIDGKIQHMLEGYSIPYTKVFGDYTAIEFITDEILKKMRLAKRYSIHEDIVL